MPLNLIKKYPELLDFGGLNEHQRNVSLKGIFTRDIELNQNLNFRTKTIRPIKGEEPSMALLFKHLTTEEISFTDDNGSIYPKRIFEHDRSQRLHWILPHLTERIDHDLHIFSVEERDQKKRQDIIRTYIYNKMQNYIIVLDPQRSQKDYYLVTAYYLNKEYGERKINKLIKKKLSDVY